jgi:hypothetical protein
MKVEHLKVYVTTSNDYVHVLKIFSYLFNKFWGPHQKVIVAGFDKYPEFNLPENFSFISLGKQDIPWTDISSDIRKLLEIVDDDYLIYFEENEFIIRPVNFDILTAYQPYINSQLGRIDFTKGVSTRPHTIIENKEKFDIISSDINASYRIAMRAGIWNKKYLLNHCKNPINPYRFESVATEKSRNDGFNILSSSRDWVIKNMDGIKHTDGPFTTNLRGLPPNRSHGLSLDEETIQDLIDLKFIKPLKNGLFQVVK